LSIGGLLVDASSWRLVFLVNLPVGVVAWRLSRRGLVESRAAGHRAMPDLRGAVLVVVVVGSLALGLVQSGDWGWLSIGVVGCFGVAALALVWFVRRSLNHPAPVIEPALFRDRSVAVANALTLIGSVGFYALSLSTVIYLMTVWGYSPLTAGLAMTPAPFMGAAAAAAAGRWRWAPARCCLPADCSGRAAPSRSCAGSGPSRRSCASGCRSHARCRPASA